MMGRLRYSAGMKAGPSCSAVLYKAAKLYACAAWRDRAFEGAVNMKGMKVRAR